MPFAIVTDSAANLPAALLNEHNITAIPFTSYLNGEEFAYESPEDFDDHAYYEAVRSGAQVTTSQINPDRYVEYMRPLLRQGRNILFVGVSSGISGSFASANIALAQLKKEFPERTIRLVDSLSAALGEGLLVLRAALCRREGLGIEATAALLEEVRTRIYHLFTVDDLQNLRRSGRISGTTAMIGSVLGIKPILTGSEEGKIISSCNVRGRKKALHTMADKFLSLANEAKSHLVAISHADCLKDAETLASLISTKCPRENVLITKHEPVTGGHIGPGALAMFFWGDAGVRKK